MATFQELMDAACASELGCIKPGSMESWAIRNQLISDLTAAIAGGGGSGTPGGAPGAVQFNNAGAFGGFGTFDVGTNLLTLPGDLLIASNLATAGRELIDSGGIVSLFWEDRVASDSNGATVSIDWEARLLHDSSGTAAINWDGRLLLDALGTPVMAWATRTLTDVASVVSLDWANRLLVDGGGVSAIDWQGRSLVDSTAAASLTWSNRQLLDAGALISVDWDNRLLVDNAGISSIDWVSRLFVDSTTVISADWQNRLLLDSAGAAALNWSSGVNVSQGIITYGTGFTVATLPAAGTAGRRAYVTDATAPAYGAAYVGGGGVTIPVFDDGVNWITT